VVSRRSGAQAGPVGFRLAGSGAPVRFWYLSARPARRHPLRNELPSTGRKRPFRGRRRSTQLLGYLAQGGIFRDAGICEYNVQLALFPLDLRKEAIEIVEVRDISLCASDIFWISFTAAANSVSRRPVM
jgi:hypothetical protein